ncbi:uncharacterized protein [Spinacia oleracea]|uniref:Secreted protein n=1 Tax=Spinacia oleracea TaxID=3562 RepID=A0ABM3QQ82_SPIOL|nr:uncharacterized protein LOC130461448 [Spinacia oleracea]
MLRFSLFLQLLTFSRLLLSQFGQIVCISCSVERQLLVAPDVFEIEEDFGRARAYNQLIVSIGFSIERQLLVALDVFEIEEDFRRARAYKQCGMSDLVQQAIESWYDHFYNGSVQLIICIGCSVERQLLVAPDVFEIEEDFGRALAYKQCGVSDLVQQEIESCPVDCIHYSSTAQLSLLEDEMQRVERVNAQTVRL